MVYLTEFFSLWIIFQQSNLKNMSCGELQVIYVYRVPKREKGDENRKEKFVEISNY